MPRTIALVEDDKAIRENYIIALRAQGYTVHAFGDRPSASKAFENSLPDLAIIDIGLVDEMEGGFLLCQQLRQLSQTLPIIFFTARDNDVDTISGFRMGADDYLTKDISMAHLLARIAALFRRTDLLSTPSQQSEQIRLNHLLVDVSRMTVSWKERPVALTVTEFWMLHAIIKRPGHVKSRQQLMDESQMVVDDSTITSHIKRMRKKFVQLDPDFDHIETVYGMGYRWQS
ncbi:proteobacterial dedicated sortase system response regulator [Alteromonas sp. ASW11-130]|uniref:proteobacterial dedicated sortase system response regulator n=1 Tax=Alteromonas sp. ASW11-130 TaxID=3015775 RepID=UPI0022419738|nr:proteobacterial dedicated sortase system response regulator [Alteromonas sp. ASW11-130]MCW8091967.1 proteobacterial dedicated sortase system response regulator [Alteromonas sp. ASW11-130]